MFDCVVIRKMCPPKTFLQKEGEEPYFLHAIYGDKKEEILDFVKDKPNIYVIWHAKKKREIWNNIDKMIAHYNSAQ